MSPYVPRRCPICGSALDPGEVCDCDEQAYADYVAAGEAAQESPEGE